MWSWTQGVNEETEKKAVDKEGDAVMVVWKVNLVKDIAIEWLRKLTLNRHNLKIVMKWCENVLNIAKINIELSWWWKEPMCQMLMLQEEINKNQKGGNNNRDSGLFGLDVPPKPEVVKCFNDKNF